MMMIKMMMIKMIKMIKMMMMIKMMKGEWGMEWEEMKIEETKR